jgi:hypothetical protein
MPSRNRVGLFPDKSIHTVQSWSNWDLSTTTSRQQNIYICLRKDKKNQVYTKLELQQQVGNTKGKWRSQQYVSRKHQWKMRISENKRCRPFSTTENYPDQTADALKPKSSKIFEKSLTMQCLVSLQGSIYWDSPSSYSFLECLSLFMNFCSFLLHPSPDTNQYQFPFTTREPRVPVMLVWT